MNWISGLLLPYGQKQPELSEHVFVAPGAKVLGDVKIGSNSSIWFNVVVRGDVCFISIGETTNVQDGTICHVTTDTYPLIVGNRVTVGHQAVLHGCTIEDDCLVGIGSIVLDGAVLGAGSFVAAGSLVVPNTKIPPRSFVLGRPAKVIREVTEKETGYIQSAAAHYVDIARTYVDGIGSAGSN